MKKTDSILWMALGCLTLGIVYIFLVTFTEIPETNQRYADTVLGFVMGTIISTILNFYFGSSNKNHPE